MRILALTALVLATPAAAVERCGPGLRMIYAEAAPRDFVTIENLSPQGWQIARIVWQLDSSEGALIFDTVLGGAGIDTAQPFAAASGAVQLADLPLIRDGDRVMALEFSGFPAGEVFRFTIDLDDTALGLPDTLVDDGEILGAGIEARFVNEAGSALTLSGTFGAGATAVIETPCTS